MSKIMKKTAKTDPGILKRGLHKNFRILESRPNPPTPSKTKLFMNAFNACYNISIFFTFKTKNLIHTYYNSRSKHNVWLLLVQIYWNGSEDISAANEEVARTGPIPKFFSSGTFWK